MLNKINFKIRCSQIHRITGGTIGLTENQEKDLKKYQEKEKLTPNQAEKLKELTLKKNNPELPKGAKTYCEEWLKEQIYKRKKEFSGKETEKGIINEDISIDFVAEMLGYGMIFKNEQQFFNDFMTGTPDVVISDCILDVKNSWEPFNFPLLDEKINPAYYAQLQGYMELTGRKKAKLVYTLTDTPIHLIEREAYYWCINNGYEELEESIFNKFVKKMTYSDIPNDLKIKVFDIEKDESFIKDVKLRVKMCNDYIKLLIKKLNTNNFQTKN